MSTTSLYLAIAIYAVVMIVIVAFFVKDANRNEALYKRTLGRLSAMYVRNAELEGLLEEKANTIYTLRKQLWTGRPAVLLDQPPEGSIVAVNGNAPWIRNGLPGAAWSTGFDDKTWSKLWTSDLLILRWGWGE